MSFRTANNAASGLVSAAGGLSTLSYPFSVVVHNDHISSGTFYGSIFSLLDTNDAFTKLLDVKQNNTGIEFTITAPGAGSETFYHSVTVADTSAGIGWDYFTLTMTDGDEILLNWQGTEDTIIPVSTKDFLSTLVGDLVVKAGTVNAAQDDFAHIAVFNHALSASEKTNAAINTPDNLGGSLPLIYQRLDADADDGIGSAWVDNDGAVPVVFDSGNNPSLTGPTPVNPIHTDGPNVTQKTENGATITGTVTEACTVQVLQTAAGSGQPTDVAFDASSDTQTLTTAGSYSVVTDDGLPLTNYRWWVRLKPYIGTDSYSSVDGTTTPVAPVITSVNGGDPVANLSTYIVTGTGFTDHEAADIDGTAQTGFTVDSDVQVTITCVRPNTRAYGQIATLNIGGGISNVILEPQAGWGYVDITSIAAEGVIGTTPALAVGNQVAYEIVNGSYVLDNGTAAADSVPTTFEAEVHDTVSWGTPGDVTIEGTATSSGGNLNDTNKAYFNGLGYTNSMSDNIFSHLRNLGYTGTVSDMLKQKTNAEGFDSINEMMREQGYEPQ
jgi:hypothetical protein